MLVIDGLDIFVNERLDFRAIQNKEYRSQLFSVCAAGGGNNLTDLENVG